MKPNIHQGPRATALASRLEARTSHAPRHFEHGDVVPSLRKTAARKMGRAALAQAQEKQARRLVRAAPAQLSENSCQKNGESCAWTASGNSCQKIGESCACTASKKQLPEKWGERRLRNLWKMNARIIVREIAARKMGRAS